MQCMVYGVMFEANDVSHAIACSPLQVGIHDRARQNMALYYCPQERFRDPRSAERYTGSKVN